ncbi:MAG TPA: hypothetical protein VFY65_20175 [Longimicrobium sp.]|nr:hypothetical protein [Longimicrobium sp.]
MMTVRVFVRWALAAPVIVPVLAYPLLLGERDPFDAAGQLLVGSAVAGLAPYLVFAIAFAAWARDRTAAEVERAAWLAPLLFLLPFTVFWLLLVTVRGGGPGAVPMVMALCAAAVAVGYAYVAAADVLYRLLARRGVIRSA